MAPNGKSPFKQWREKLKDPATRQQVDSRIARMRVGNFGDHRTVGGGVSEIRINYGPGYRIYYGRHGDTLVVLLSGGDKKSQETDIDMARRYWKEYKAKG